MSEFKLTPEILALCGSLKDWMQTLEWIGNDLMSEYQTIEDLQFQLREDLENYESDIGWFNHEFCKHARCWGYAAPMFASISYPYEITRRNKYSGRYCLMPINAAYGTSAHDAVVRLAHRVLDRLNELPELNYHNNPELNYEMSEEQNTSFFDGETVVFNLLREVMNLIPEYDHSNVRLHLEYEAQRLIEKYGTPEDLAVYYGEEMPEVIKPTLSEDNHSFTLGNNTIQMKPRLFQIYSYVYQNPYCPYSDIEKLLDSSVEQATIKRYITEINRSFKNAGLGNYRIQSIKEKHFIETPVPGNTNREIWHFLRRKLSRKKGRMF
ncbi:hypothetical protein [Gimesia chilikensis]|uniref:hypothetical protein n=1 Tax=Gimesia chilikensis TaxID=2605989 RepID=UPI003A8D25BF